MNWENITDNVKVIELLKQREEIENQISIQEKRKELAEIEARLNALISPELKAEMELDAISKLLDVK